jgi:hypothetical protein
MGISATLQASRYFIRQRQRGRQFALALTPHQAGLIVIGCDVTGKWQLADFVQDSSGNPWVAATSGTTGSGTLAGTAPYNDGGVTWVLWSGKILSPPNTPAA